MELYATFFSLNGDIHTIYPSFTDLETCFNFIREFIQQHTLPDVTGYACVGPDTLERLGIFKNG